MVLFCTCETNSNEIVLTDPVADLNAIRIDKLFSEKKPHMKFITSY